MRSRFITSLCSLVVMCCVVAVVARAQAASAQTQTDNASQPAPKSPAKRRPTKKVASATKKTAPADAAATTDADAQTTTPKQTGGASKSAAGDDAKQETDAAKKETPVTVAARRRAALRAQARKKAAASDAAKSASDQPAPSTEKPATSEAGAAAQSQTTDAGAAKPEKKRTTRTARRGVVKKDAGAAKTEANAPDAQASAPKTEASETKTEASSTETETPTRATQAGVKKTTRAKLETTPNAKKTVDAEKTVDAAKKEATASDATTVDAASKSAKPKAANAGVSKTGAKKSAANADESKPDAPKSAAELAKEAEYKSKLAEILKLPAWERIAELQDFIELDLPDDVADRAEEHLVSSEAAYGDERLQAGDAARGIALFRDAVENASPDMSNRLFFDVVSQLPANLILRGQTEAGFDLARKIEAKAKGDAKRLLAVAAFYVTAEQPTEAARIAAQAVKLAPDLAAAHQALAAADRLSLKLDDSAAEYARAAALDPKSVNARHSLADMRRATGKPEDALAIYRELLAADPTDTTARNGVVLSLFDAGRRAEAEREFDAALKADAHNVQLLAGAAYWYAAHNDAKRALDLAGQATQIEPRHPWAQIALARALVANKMPFDAERSIRFARLFSRFPTLDYELAHALSAAGLYAEAADELARSFAVKDGQVETRLAGRVPARAESFVELLAPERRASLFEPVAADTAENARALKGLLSLHTVLKSAETPEQRAAIEPAAAAAAQEFARGDDAMRAFRQLYAANRLLRRNVAARTALELVAAARKSVDDALALPQATVATTADELRDVRAQAIQQGATPGIPDLPRDVLDKLLRGRVEELTGWALLNEGKSAEAVSALRLSVGLLPEQSPYWRDAMWRLGTALAVSGEPQQALNTYIASYDADEPDAARLSIIHALYRKLNGTTAGLDALIGSAAPPRAASPVNTPTTATAAPTEVAKSEHAPTVTPDIAQPKASATPDKIAEPSSDAAKSSDTKKGERKSAEVKSSDVKSGETAQPATHAEVKIPTPEPVASPTPDATPSPTPAPSPSPEATGESKKADDAKVAPSPSPSPLPSSSPTPTPSPSSSSAESQSPTVPAARHTSAAGECAMTLSSDDLSLAVGASGSVVVTLEGDSDPAKITASTPDWSDIIVLREPASATAANAAKFTITSISKSAGAFTLKIKSPCGEKNVKVSVK